MSYRRRIQKCLVKVVRLAETVNGSQSYRNSKGGRNFKTYIVHSKGIYRVGGEIFLCSLPSNMKSKTLMLCRTQRPAVAAQPISAGHPPTRPIPCPAQAEQGNADGCGQRTSPRSHGRGLSRSPFGAFKQPSKSYTFKTHTFQSIIKLCISLLKLFQITIKSHTFPRLMLVKELPSSPHFS
jgi:hypothetical protein